METLINLSLIFVGVSMVIIAGGIMYATKTQVESSNFKD